MEILELDKPFTTVEARSFLEENLDLKAVQLPESQANRLADSTIIFLESQGVAIIKKLSGSGRPKFKATPELIEKVQNLKSNGKSLTETAKELNLSPSTLYVHIWKKLQ
ncbi:hypothetical protein ACFLQI_03200 [Candidatus Undinarchaeota archaeon]